MRKLAQPLSQFGDTSIDPAAGVMATGFIQDKINEPVVHVFGQCETESGCFRPEV